MKFTLLGIFEKGNRSIIQFDDMQDGVSLSNLSNFLLMLKNEQTILRSVRNFVYFMDIKLKFLSEMTRITKLPGKA